MGGHHVTRGREVVHVGRNRAGGAGELVRGISDIAGVVGDIARDIADLEHVRGEHEREGRTSWSWFANLVVVV